MQAAAERFIDAQKANGCTALHLAAQSDHAEMVELLVRGGCKVEVKNRSGLKAIEVAQQLQRSRAVQSLQALCP